MATRKEERERLRQLRQEAEKRGVGDQRRRLLIGYAIAGVLGLAVIAGIVVLIGSSGGGVTGGKEAHINVATGQTNGVKPDDRSGPAPPAIAVGNLQQAAKDAGCVLRLNLPDEGHTHVQEGTKVKYKTDPPTSGGHALPPAQQADGAYAEMPEPLDFVHSLEHGRMEIQYSSKLPESNQEALKGLYDTLYGGTLLFPNNDMPYQVAATTWTNLIGCKTYEGAKTMDAIRDFGRETWNRYGAESELNNFPIAGPTPADAH
jgi:hypothetical protein